MRLTVNEQPVEGPEHTGSLGDLLEVLSQQLSQKGQFISDVRVDGAPLTDSPGDHELRQHPSNHFKRIEILAEDVEAATRRGLREVRRNLTLLRHIATTVQQEHHKGAHDIASEKLVVAIEMLSELSLFLGLCAQHLGDTKGSLLKDHLIPFCSQLEEAQRREDWAKVNGILKSELPQVVSSLQSWSQELNDRVNTVP